jgi:hypothetical protein
VVSNHSTLRTVRETRSMPLRMACWTDSDDEPTTSVTR